MARGKGRRRRTVGNKPQFLKKPSKAASRRGGGAQTTRASFKRAEANFKKRGKTITGQTEGVNFSRPKGSVPVGQFIGFRTSARSSVGKQKPSPRRTTSPASQNVRKAFDPAPQFDSPFIRQVRQSGQDTRQSIFNLGQQARSKFDSGDLNPIKIIQDVSQRNATRKEELKAAGKLPAQRNKARLEKAKAERDGRAFNIDDIFGRFI